LNSPIGWPGGKRRLVKRLLSLLPEHRTYAEPFCGSAKLLFAKDPSETEVISDANGDLINFFLVTKYRPSALAEQFESAISHPAWFKKLLKSKPDNGDEVQRAFRFAYLTWLSFGTMGETFAGSTPRKRLGIVRDQLARTSSRLHNVAIECADYAEIVAKYDAPDTVFFCDPPYVDYCSNGRYEAFDGDKLAFLFNLLAKIKGKFIMSEENHPDVKKHVASHGMQCRSVLTTYSLSKSSNAQVKTELLISNFPLRSLAAAKS
jgi:DNA adenine methylase